jgi:hypothetical protein
VLVCRELRYATNCICFVKSFLVIGGCIRAEVHNHDSHDAGGAPPTIVLSSLVKRQ